MIYRFAEKFKINVFPNPSGIDIYAQNFVSLLHKLDDAIEICRYCSENPVGLKWEAPSKKKIEEWVV